VCRIDRTHIQSRRRSNYVWALWISAAGGSQVEDLVDTPELARLTDTHPSYWHKLRVRGDGTIGGAFRFIGTRYHFNDAYSES
jgi:hypothetical protein